MPFRHSKKLTRQVAAIRAARPRGTPMELRWQDEARVGHKKGGVTGVVRGAGPGRRLAKIPARPRKCLGAIFSAQGKDATLVLPRA